MKREYRPTHTPYLPCDCVVLLCEFLLPLIPPSTPPPRLKMRCSRFVWLCPADEHQHGSHSFLLFSLCRFPLYLSLYSRTGHTRVDKVQSESPSLCPSAVLSSSAILLIQEDLRHQRLPMSKEALFWATLATTPGQGLPRPSFFAPSTECVHCVVFPSPLRMWCEFR